MSASPGRRLRVGAALLLLAYSILPLAEWIPGGQTLSGYALVAEGWVLGGLIALGAGWILGLVWDKSPEVAGRVTEMRALWERWAVAPATPAVVAGVAFLAYGVVAITVFDRLPLNIDEIIQLWQGRMYAAGEFKLPSPGPLDLFGVPHVIDDGTWRFGQFPLGGGLMLVPGVLLGAEWLAGPLFGAAGVFGFARLLPHVESRASVRLGALLLFAFCPFALFMSGSYMNHVPTLAWSVLGLWGVAAGMARRSAWAFLGAGVAFGWAGIVRPVDAFAVAAPLGAWILWRAFRREVAWRHLVLFVLGGIGPVLLLGWANAATTGSPTLLGYQALWGAAHNLGFHAAPWGEPHTPIVGVELINAYLFGLNSFLLETPFPALLPVLAWLAVGPKLEGWDRYFLASGALLLLFYFAYWFNGFYLGPRFMYPLIPLLALGTARAWPAIAAAGWPPALSRTVAGALLVGAAMAAGYGTPLRAGNNAELLSVVRWSADQLATEAGATEGIVLVRESWGAQMIARLWGRGVSRADAEFIYHRHDACDLERTLDSLERVDATGAAVTARLMATADTTGLLKSPVSPDRSEPFRPGTTYDARCIARISEDRNGFTVLPPTLLAHGDLIWVRDLHARTRSYIERHPEVPLWLLTSPDTLVGTRPLLRPVSRDSLFNAWGAPR